jgi:LysR family glycine cleavage system transcriptional activator
MNMHYLNPLPTKPEASNVEPAHAADAYPLPELIRPRPSIQGLQTFVAVARLGSLSKAASLLCRTQGAVSRQIQQLEAHYQTALFLRSSSGMLLTTEGGQLLEVADQVLVSLADHARSQAVVAATLHLRLPSSLALRWFLPRQAVLQQQMPDVTLEISTSVDDEPDFAGETVDAMIVRGAGEWSGMFVQELFPEQLVPMCSPDRARMIQTPADLANDCLLHAAADRMEWQHWLQQAGVERTGGRDLAFDSLDMALGAAAAGYGIAMGDPRMARHKLASGELVPLFPASLFNHLSYYLVVPEQRREQKKIQQLLMALRRLVAEG